MRLILFCSFLLMSSSIFGQGALKPVSWTFDSNQVGPNDYELVFMAKIDKPWVVYGIKTKEGGPVPTSITFTSDNIELIGEPKEMGKMKAEFDKLFEMDVVKFYSDQTYVIKQKVKLKDINKSITGYVTYMSCNNATCLPPEDADFSFTFKTKAPVKMGIDGKPHE